MTLFSEKPVSSCLLLHLVTIHIYYRESTLQKACQSQPTGDLDLLQCQKRPITASKETYYIESTLQKACQSQPTGDLSTGQNRCLFFFSAVRQERHVARARHQKPVPSTFTNNKSQVREDFFCKRGLFAPLKIY